jgi:hypothetical protein
MGKDEALAAHVEERADKSGEPMVEEKSSETTRELTEWLRRAMVPVDPPAAFVRSLGRELVEASHRQRQAARRLRRGLIIGAAALGSAVSAGLVTLLLLRRRSQTRSQPARG